MNNEKIAKINSKYLLNNIFSFVKYEHALNIMKHNKALQNKLNITLNDYTIDCQFMKRFEEEEYGEYMINKKSNDNCFLSSFIIILQISILICSIMSIRYWKNNFFNVYLILDIVYKALVIFYLLMKIFWNIINDQCQPCYFCMDIFLNSILLIILICKILSDKKDINNKKTLLKLDSALITFCIVLIIILFIYIFLYSKKEQKPNSGIIKKKKVVEINIALINKFRGFNVKKLEYTNLKSYGLITSEDIGNILEFYLEYIIDDNQVDLIKLINNLRKKKNIKELKYSITEKLDDFFIHVKRFYALDYINKINNNIYLFIYPKYEFKSMVLENDDKIMKIIYNKYFDHILILEKNNNEYILIYNSNNNEMVINDNNNSTDDTDRKDLLKLKQNY